MFGGRTHLKSLERPDAHMWRNNSLWTGAVYLGRDMLLAYTSLAHGKLPSDPRELVSDAVGAMRGIVSILTCIDSN
jgi:hypothetical protein